MSYGIVLGAQHRCAHYVHIMDYTISKDDIGKVLRDFDRKKHREIYQGDADKSKEITSAIGTETPITVLIDIRQTLCEVLSETSRTNQIMLECLDAVKFMQSKAAEDTSEMHRQSLAYMQQMTDAINTLKFASSSVSSAHTPSLHSLPVQRSASAFYYRGDKLKTPESVIGCVFLHLNHILSKMTSEEVGTSDTTLMELTDWSSAVRLLKAADSVTTPNHNKLTLPKLSSDEVTYALNLIASPAPGRATVCKPEHILDLSSNCPTLMSCVEEIRVRAVACPGIISASRCKRLASVSYPFVTSEGTLNITDKDFRVPGSRIVIDMVRSMTIPQKKSYCNLILKECMKPISAANAVLDVSQQI